MARRPGLVAPLALALAAALAFAARGGPSRPPKDLPLLSMRVEGLTPRVDARLRSHESPFRAEVPLLDGRPGPVPVPRGELLELDLQQSAVRIRLPISPVRASTEFSLDAALPNEIVVHSPLKAARPVAAVLRFDELSDRVSSAVTRTFTLDRFPFRVARLPDARGTLCVLHEGRAIERHAFDIGPARRRQDIRLVDAAVTGSRLSLRSATAGGDVAPLAGFRIVDHDGIEYFAGFTGTGGTCTVDGLPPEIALLVRPRDDAPNYTFPVIDVGRLRLGESTDLPVIVTKLPRFQVSFGPGWDADLPVTIAVSDEAALPTDAPFALRELERPASLRLSFPPGARAVRVEAVQAGSAAVARARVERHSTGEGRRVQLLPPEGTRVEVQVGAAGTRSQHGWVVCEVAVEGLPVRTWAPMVRVGASLVVPVAAGDRRVFVHARPARASTQNGRVTGPLGSLELRADGLRSLVLALSD